MFVSGSGGFNYGNTGELSHWPSLSELQSYFRINPNPQVIAADSQYRPLLCTENSFLKIDDDTCHSKSSNGTTWKDVKEHKERNLIITRTSLITTNAA